MTPRHPIPLTIVAAIGGLIHSCIAEVRKRRQLQRRDASLPQSVSSPET